MNNDNISFGVCDMVLYENYQLADILVKSVL